MDQEKQALLQEAGERLRMERQRLGLSQAQAAEKTGITREMWGRYERGSVNINGHVLAQFIEIGASESFLRRGVSRSARFVEQDEVSKALSVIADAMEQVCMNADEMRLIAGFRAANAERKRILLELAGGPVATGT